jgi:hypothetical protein
MAMCRRYVSVDFPARSSMFATQQERDEDALASEVLEVQTCLEHQIS